ncbi:MAG: hypothetical protein M3R44_08060 [Candidatus Eremiobacteraeota bacterium]|nr:hypothetical protein [Candidatus Eremiobacteraeota bacterium]
MLLSLLFAATVAAAAPSPSHNFHGQIRPPATSGRCLDSFLAAGQRIAPPNDVSRGVQHTRADRIIRVDIVQAKSFPGNPIVGFLYISEQGNVLFSTRRRQNIQQRVTPLILEIFAAASTATAAQLRALLNHQDGNAVLYLRHPFFLKRLPVRAIPCVVLSKDAR